MNVPKMEGYAEKNGVISFFSRGSFSDCGLYLEVPKKEVLSGLSRMRLFPDRNIRGSFCGSCAAGTVALQGGLRTTSDP